MKTATIMPVVTNLWNVKTENCTAWKSGTARKSSLNLVTNQAKAEGKGRVKLTETVSAVDALVTFEQTAEPKLTSMEDPPKSAPKGKGVGNCEDEETQTSQNVPLVTIDLGSFHGDEVDVDDSTNETTEMKTKRMHSLIVGMGSTSSPTLCNKWIVGPATHRNLHPT